MAKIEPGAYEPRGDDIRVFDGAEDDIDEEGSRLPLLIAIALLVLAAFAGVVYLAYTEGVSKGHSDLPRVIAAQPGPAKVAPTDGGGTVTPYKGLKIYEQPAPTDEEADQDSVPQPPTPVKPTTNAATQAATPAPTMAGPAPTTTTMAGPVSPAAKPTGAPATTVAKTAPTTTAKASPPVQATAKAAETKTPAQAKVAVTPPASTKVAVNGPATAAPRSLTPPVTTTAPPKTAPAVAPTQAVEPKTAPAATTAAPAATGTFLVQVGSYPSEADAQAAFADLKRKNAALLSGYSSNIKKVDLGAKGTWYRLRVGPVADKDAASALAARIGGGAFASKP